MLSPVLPPATSFTSISNITYGASRRIWISLVVLLGVACLSSALLHAEVARTRTTLEVSPGHDRNPVQAVTFTATVTANGQPVSPGIVTFCDASAPFCEDLAVLGTASVLGNGTASLKKVFAPGSHRVYAIFNQTQSNASSRSETRAFEVGNRIPTTTTVSTSSGDPASVLATVTATGTAPLEGAVALIHDDSWRALIAPLRNSTPTASFGPLASYASQSTNALEPGAGPIISGTGPSVVADFNGDGLPDIAIAFEIGFGDAQGSALAVFLSDPAHPGQFQIGTLIGFPAAGSLVAGDFNRDGALDIVATTSSEFEGIQQYLLPGDPAHPGQFSDTDLVNFSNSDGIFTYAADMNQDGVLDLVGLNLYGADGAVVDILYGDPAHPGQFINETTYPAGDGAYEIAVADLNGDGVPDLAVADYSYPTGEISVLLGDPTHPGQFGAPVAIPASESSIRQTLAIADFNRDGLPDILTTFNQTEIAVLLNDRGAPAEFPTADLYPLNGYSGPIIGAFRTPNILDLALFDSDNSSLEILPADPLHPGQFLPPVSQSLAVPDGYLEFGLYADDLNGDGLTDLINIFSAFGVDDATPFDFTVDFGVLLNQATQTASATFHRVSDGRAESALVHAEHLGDSDYQGSRSCSISLGVTSPSAPVVSDLRARDIRAKSAVITWSGGGTADTVDYGTTTVLSGTSHWVREDPSSGPRRDSILLKDLTPNTTYYYQLKSASFFSGCTHKTSVSPVESFTTAP